VARLIGSAPGDSCPNPLPQLLMVLLEPGYNVAARGGAFLAAPKTAQMERDFVQFLQDLRAEGEIDSNGTFTIDQREARRKLRHYQLLHPHHYLAPLLAAAHLGGAEQVDVELQRDRVLVSWRGAALTQTQLEQLFTTLFGEGDQREQRRLRELAVGLNAAMALRPHSLQVWSGAILMNIQGSSETFEPVEEWIDGLRIELRFGALASLRRGLRASLLGRFPEHSVLEQLCRFAAPQLRVNGQALEAPSFGESCLASGLLRGGAQALLERARPLSPVTDFWVGSGPHGALLTLHAGLGTLRAVLDGITFDLTGVGDLGVEGCSALLVAPQLSKNLSSSGIVENEVWLELLTELRRYAIALTQALADGYSRLQPEQQREALPAMRSLVRHHCKSKQWDSANEVLRKMLGLLEQSAPNRDRLDAHYAALLVLRETDNVDAYHRGLRLMAEWGPAVLGVEIRPNLRGESEVMSVAYRLLGDRAAVERAHLFFLEVEERILGTDHHTPFDRIDQLRRLYAVWGWKVKASSLQARLTRRADRSEGLLTGAPL
jgi:hypothetical protein